jgi:hypothetical protein
VEKGAGKDVVMYMASNSYCGHAADLGYLVSYVYMILILTRKYYRNYFFNRQTKHRHRHSKETSRKTSGAP